jgi:hypothetical protein
MTELGFAPDSVLQVPDERIRHWCPQSQKYAPGDVLLAYLRNGWALDPVAEVERVYYSGYRCVEVFYFVLANGDQVLKMPVIANPRIHKLVEENRIKLFQIKSSEVYF